MDRASESRPEEDQTPDPSTAPELAPNWVISQPRDHVITVATIDWPCSARRRSLTGERAEIASEIISPLSKPRRRWRVAQHSLHEIGEENEIPNSPPPIHQLTNAETLKL